MDRRAWAYICGVLALATGLALQAGISFRHAHPHWMLVELLLVLALGAQLFKVEGSNHVLFYATPIFLFAGAVLLDPLLLFVLIVASHLAEWLKERWIGSSNLRLWYLQPFNVAMFWIAGRAAQVVLGAMGGHHAVAGIWQVAAVMLAALVWLSINHGLLGFALVLARGVSWRESGQLDGDSLMSDLALVCVGSTVAVVWTIQPWFILPALAPIFFMYRALMIPQLKQEAETDAKTGLNNARHFNELVAGELERAQRFDRPLTFIMADLDFLRDINNTYGHLAGDAVLSGIGKTIRSTIREYDVAGRFGGEEFAIALPETDEAEARLLAERVRGEVEAARFSLAGSQTTMRVTMSLGIACFPQDGHTVQELMHAADVAVYAAKSGGRNRVVCASEAPLAERGVGITGPSPVEVIPAQSPLNGAPIKQGRRANDEANRDAPAGWAGPAFVSCVTLAGLAVALVAILMMPLSPVLPIVLLTVLAAAAEGLEVDLLRQGTVSVSVGIAFTAALLTGIDGLLCVSCAIAGVHHLLQRRGLRTVHRAAFNAAVHLLAGLPVIAVLAWQHLPLGSHDLVWLLPTIIPASVAYFLIDTGLVAVAVALTRGDALLKTWRSTFRWLFTHYIVLCLMGLALSITFTDVGPPGVAIFVLPLLMMHFVQKQHVSQARDNLHALQRLNRDLLHAALHDHLTGLGNERGYHEVLRREVEDAAARGTDMVLAHLNVDEFKAINEEQGRRQGDDILIELASLLNAIPRVYHAFRLAADEFGVVFCGISEREVLIILEEFRVEAPARLGGATVSVGLACLETTCADADQLSEQAAEALSEAKRRGRNALVAFDEIRDTTLVASGAQVQSVRRLLADNTINVVFQPIWDLHHNSILGYEALSRPATGYGLVGPQQAFDLATRLGRGHDLDALCRHAVLARAHDLPPGAVLFINVAPESLEQNRLSGPALVDAVLAAGLSPQQIVLEITERSIIRLDTVVPMAQRLREYGFRLALDDTGAGNAGLGVLSQLQVDFIKVDGSVVIHAATDQSARAVLAGIVAVAHEMGAYLIAEAIETVEMLHLVREMTGVNAGNKTGQGHGVQGHLLGMPNASMPEPGLHERIEPFMTGDTGRILSFPVSPVNPVEGKPAAVAW